MSNTNDPKAPYGKMWTGEPRNRLLSVHEMMMGSMQAMDVADFYENLIDKGELRVVKKVTDVGDHWSDPTCSDCGTKTVVWAKFCPVCGGEIQK